MPVCQPLRLRSEGVASAARRVYYAPLSTCSPVLTPLCRFHYGGLTIASTLSALPIFSIT